MKYIDADKLIAEITRLKGQLIRGACASQVEMETNCKDEAYNEVLAIIDSLQQEQPEVDLNSKVTFDCISKKVTMSVQELINYYIDKECCDVADECGF